MNELENLLNAIKSLTDIKDEDLNDELIKAILQNLDEQFTPPMVDK